MNSFLILPGGCKKLLYYLSGAVAFYFPLFSAYSLECRGAFSKSSRGPRDFEQAVEYVRALNFSFIADYHRWSKSGQRPSDIPSHPDRTYKKRKQWRGWGYYLGESFVDSKRRFKDFEPAVEYIRALGLQSSKEHEQWSQSGKRPVDIPSRPYKVYKDQWRGWDYYLGESFVDNRKGGFRDFEPAVEYVRAFNFRNSGEYDQWSQSGKKPADIPADPYQAYKDQWRGWDYYLGESFVDSRTREFREFEPAVEYIHALGLQSSKEHEQWSQSGNRPADIPADPYRVYKSKWRSWGHYLGTGVIANRKRKFRDFEPAVEYIRALGLRESKEHREWSKSGKRPVDIPSNPYKVYKDQWRGWGYYLGTGAIAGRKKEFREFELAVEYIRALNFRGVKEHGEWSKSGKRPVDIPSHPERVYKDQWQGWEYYLGTVGFNWKKKEKKPASGYYWSFAEAKNYVLGLNFESVKSFLEWLRSDERPSEFPLNPHEAYPAWTNTRDFLNLSMSYNKAKEYLRTLERLESEDQFKQWAVSDERPPDFPSNPQTFYKKQWEGWDVFLGVFVEKKKKISRPVEGESDQNPPEEYILDDEQIFYE